MGGVCGMVVMALPFVIYLSVVCAFGAFIHEYFVNTLATTQNTSGDKTRLELIWEYLTIRLMMVVPTVAILVGSSPAFMRFKNYRWMPAAVILLMFLINAATMLRPHYIQIIGFAAICFFSWIVCLINGIKIFKKHSLLDRWWPMAFFICMLPILYQGFLGLELKGSRNYTPSNRELADRAITLWCQAESVTRPTILYPNGLDWGLGLEAGALPASKHWFRQAYPTAEMERAREDALKSGVADIVIINYNDTEPDSEIPGYRMLYRTQRTNSDASFSFLVFVRDSTSSDTVIEKHKR